MQPVEAELAPYLARSPWFAAYATTPFGPEPAGFVAPLVAEMLRSGAARWQAGRLVATPPHWPPSPACTHAATEPARWP